MAIAVAGIMAVVARTHAVSCVGDCDGDGRVAVNELVAGVDMLLYGTAVCSALECNDSGLGILLDCFMVAVNNALNGCYRARVGAVWLYDIPCRQCGDCPFDLLGIARKGMPDDILPDDVTVLDTRTEWVQNACLACGCPEPGSPIYHVLVPPGDVERLMGLGWVPER